MLARDSLLALLLTDLVGFARDQRDELHTAFDEEVARIFAKRKSG